MKKIGILILSSLFLFSCNENNVSNNTSSTTEKDTTSENSSKTENTSSGLTFEEKITKQPTCEEDGEKTFTCLEDASKSYTETIPHLGHLMSEPTRNDEWTKMVSSCTREGCSKKEEKTIAKIILMAGQSNMVGHSFTPHLSEEEKIKYEQGFDNVLINFSNNPYSSTTKNTSNGFTKVKLGQGKATDYSKYPLGTFGPEVGLAEYLNQNYPNETFYLVKNATGGASLHDNWYSPRSNETLPENSLYKYFVNYVHESIKLIEEKDLYPEIVSFCWMQGENDSNSYIDDYERLWSNFVLDIKDEFKDYITPNGLSIIDGGITNYWVNYAKMNFIKRSYASKSSKNHFIDVDNSSWISVYKDNTDYAHLDVHAMLNLGREFAKNIELVIKDLKNKEIVYEEAKFDDKTWNGTYSTSLKGSGVETDPYLIETEEDLAFFAEDVKGGNKYQDKFVKLTNDLNMTNPLFTGIGDGDIVDNKYVYNEFAGTFDGDNHNIKLNIYKNFVSGLFNASSGIIKNVKTSGTVFTANRVAGGIVGYQIGGTVSNCENNAKVSGRFYKDGKGHIGGIVGYSKGTITNCVNNGDVYGNVTKYADNQGVGGIVGTAENIEVSNCINNGVVTNFGFSTGGIIGVVRKSGLVISNNKNYGEINGSEEGTGGIVGISNFKNVTISDCHNYASVIGGSYVGGVCGAFGYTADMTGSIMTNCSNEGTILSKQEAGNNKKYFRVGGIAGMAFGTAIDSCVNKGKVSNINENINVDLGTEETKYSGLIVGYKTKNATINDCSNTYGK